MTTVNPRLNEIIKQEHGTQVGVHELFDVFKASKRAELEQAICYLLGRNQIHVFDDEK